MAVIKALGAAVQIAAKAAFEDAQEFKGGGDDGLIAPCLERFMQHLLNIVNFNCINWQKIPDPFGDHRFVTWVINIHLTRSVLEGVRVICHGWQGYLAGRNDARILVELFHDVRGDGLVYG